MSAVLKFKDEDEIGTDKLINIIIEPVGNGYVVTFSYEDSGEFKKVYMNKVEMFKEIGAKI